MSHPNRFSDDNITPFTTGGQSTQEHDLNADVGAIDALSSSLASLRQSQFPLQPSCQQTLRAASLGYPAASLHHLSAREAVFSSQEFQRRAALMDTEQRSSGVIVAPSTASLPTASQLSLSAIEILHAQQHQQQQQHNLVQQLQLQQHVQNHAALTTPASIRHLLGSAAGGGVGVLNPHSAAVAQMRVQALREEERIARGRAAAASIAAMEAAAEYDRLQQRTALLALQQRDQIRQLQEQQLAAAYPYAAMASALTRSTSLHGEPFTGHLGTSSASDPVSLNTVLPPQAASSPLPDAVSETGESRSLENTDPSIFNSVIRGQKQLKSVGNKAPLQSKGNSDRQDERGIASTALAAFSADDSAAQKNTDFDRGMTVIATSENQTSTVTSALESSHAIDTKKSDSFDACAQRPSTHDFDAQAGVPVNEKVDETVREDTSSLQKEKYSIESNGNTWHIPPVQDVQKALDTLTNASWTDLERKLAGFENPYAKVNGKRLRPIASVDEILRAMPDDASSVLHIMDRRIDLDDHHKDASFFALLRSWVQDDPGRRTRPKKNLLDHAPLPSQRRVLDHVKINSPVRKKREKETSSTACDVLLELSNQQDSNSFELKGCSKTMAMRSTKELLSMHVKRGRKLRKQLCRKRKLVMKKKLETLEKAGIIKR